MGCFSSCPEEQNKKKLSSASGAPQNRSSWVPFSSPNASIIENVEKNVNLSQPKILSLGLLLRSSMSESPKFHLK